MSVTPVVLPAQAPLNLPEEPVIPEVPSSPCGYKLCGRVKCIDAIAVPVEIGSGSACIYFALQGAAFTAGSWGTLCVLCIGAHLGWKKYGDLDAIAERLKAASDTMKQTIAQYGELIGQWTGQVAAVNAANQQLETANGVFQAQTDALNITIQQIGQELEQFKKTNEELTHINAELKSHVEQLGKTNEDLQARIHDFKTHIGSFKKEILKVEGLIPSIQETSKSLDHSINRLDFEFDQDLDQFEAQIKEVQNHFRLIVATLQKENEDLKSQVGHLDHEGDELRETTKALGEELQQIQELYLKTNQELEEIKAQLAPHLAALKDETKVQIQVAQHLGQEREALDAALQGAAGLENRVAALHAAIGASLADQQTQTKATEEELREIENL